MANALQVLLDHDCEAEVWTQGLFEPGGSTLQSLAQAAKEFDFAILVVSPDDTTVSRGVEKNATRDNVIFELGLFMGALGHERTFMVYDRTRRPDLPTDLAGVTPADYAPHRSGKLISALGAATTKIRSAIRRHGFRDQGPLAAIGTDWLEQVGKVVAQAMFAAPEEQRSVLWAKLQKSGAPQPLMNPIQRSLDYTREVRASLDNLLAGSALQGFSMLTEDAERTELVIQAPDGRRIYVDLAPDFFAMNDMEIITPTIRMRAHMLQAAPLYGGQVLVSRDIPENLFSEVKADMAEDPETTGAVGVVEYREQKHSSMLLAAIRKIADRPMPGSVSAYKSMVLETLKDEVRSGAASRYLREPARYVSFPISASFDAVFDRITDSKLIMIDVREGFYADDPASGIDRLRQDLEHIYQSAGFVASVGGVLIVTDHLPSSAVEAFVAQIDQAKSSVAMVMAHVTGPADREKLIRALRQTSYQPGQEYE